MCKFYIKYLYLLILLNFIKICIFVNRINALNEYDEKKSRREGALNALESAVIDSMSKIDDNEFSSFAKPDEAKIISSKSKEVFLCFHCEINTFVVFLRFNSV